MQQQVHVSWNSALIGTKISNLYCDNPRLCALPVGSHPLGSYSCQATATNTSRHYLLYNDTPAHNLPAVTTLSN